MVLLLDAIITIAVWLIVVLVDNALQLDLLPEVYRWLFDSAVAPIWGELLIAASLFILLGALSHLILTQEVRLAIRAKASKRPHFLKGPIYFLDEIVGNQGEAWPPFFLVPATILHLMALMLVFQNPSALRPDVWCAILIGLVGLWGLYLIGLPSMPHKVIVTPVQEPETGAQPVEGDANVKQFSFVATAWQQKWFHNQIVFQIPWPTDKPPVDSAPAWHSSIERFKAREDVYAPSEQHTLLKESKPLETILEQLKIDPRPEGNWRLYSHQGKVLDILEGDLGSHGEQNHVLLSTPVGSGRTSIDLIAALYKIFCKHQSVLIVLPTARFGQLVVEQLKQAFQASRWDWSISIVSYWSTEPKPRLIHRKKITDPTLFAPDILIVDLETIYDRLLPNHQEWQYFIAQLGLVIVENLESYTGILGANASMVFSRLMRLARHYHSKPQILAHTVKLEAEESFFEQFFALRPDDFSPMNIVDEDGRSSRPKQVIFWNPEMAHRKSTIGQARELTRSSYLDDLLKILIMLGEVNSKSIVLHKTVTLCDADMTATNQSLVAEFQGKQRREIDVSTGAAMETVFDQSNLPRLAVPDTFDSAVVSGVPGSFMNIMHDLEHIGNASQWESQPLVVLLPDNPLAQFVSRRAPEFVHLRQNPVENPLPVSNPFIQAKHLLGALAELPLTREEIAVWFGDNGQEVLDRFIENGRVRKTEIPLLNERGQVVLDSEGNVMMTTRYEMVNRDEYQPSTLSGLGEKVWKFKVDGFEKATLDGDTIGWDIYRNATWVYANQRFHITGVDFKLKVVSASNVPQALSSERMVKVDIEFLSRDTNLDQGNLPVHLKCGDESINYLAIGQVQIIQRSPLWALVREKILGCREYKAFTYERSAVHILSPEMERPPFWTRAFVVGIPGAELKVIHTIAHLIRVALPLFLRGEPPFEVFEMSTCNLVENHPSLVVYDAIAGGTGVADWLGRGNNFQKVLESALSILESCPCESGCRGCTSIHDCHIPNSKSTTCELDKIGTIQLLAEILGKEVDDLIKFRTSAIELSEDVHKMVQHLVDFVFPHKLGLEIEQPANIQVKPNLDSRFRGIYFSANNEVWVMPLKEMDMLMVLAHEYAHNWQWQGKNRMCTALMEASTVPYFDGKLFIEGFAQWVEYKVADYYGYRVEMDQIHFAHYNEYAEGFQVLRWIEDAGGAGKVMEFIRMGKLTLDGQDIPLERMIDRSGVRARLQDWKNRFETTPPDNDVDVPVEETEGLQEDDLDSSTKDPDTDEKESTGPKTEGEPVKDQAPDVTPNELLGGLNG